MAPPIWHTERVTTFRDRVSLGSTGLQVSRLGLGSSFGLSTREVERAFDSGVNYFYWGSIRRPMFGRALRHIAKRERAGMVTVIQTYTRVAALMRASVEVALRPLGLDYTDVLLLGWWNDVPPPAIMDAAQALVEAGLARHVMVSCHNRPSFERIARHPLIDSLMVRYNAGHPGAEKDVFPLLPRPRPGVVAYTATRWGTLLDPKLTPPGERTPRASDCYRFALSHPDVDLVLSGPAGGSQLDEALTVLDQGPMSPEERAWMLRVGLAARNAPQTRALNPAHLFDKMTGFLTGQS